MNLGTSPGGRATTAAAHKIPELVHAGFLHEPRRRPRRSPGAPADPAPRSQVRDTLGPDQGQVSPRRNRRSDGRPQRAPGRTVFFQVQDVVLYIRFAGTKFRLELLILYLLICITLIFL